MASGWLLMLGALMIAAGIIGYTVVQDKRAADAIDEVLSPERDWDIADLLTPEAPVEVTVEIPAVEWDEVVDYGDHSAHFVRFVVDYVARHAEAVTA